MSLDYFDQKKIENLNKIIDQLAETIASYTTMSSLSAFEKLGDC